MSIDDTRKRYNALIGDMPTRNHWTYSDYGDDYLDGDYDYDYRTKPISKPKPFEGFLIADCCRVAIGVWKPASGPALMKCTRCHGEIDPKTLKAKDPTKPHWYRNGCFTFAEMLGWIMVGFNEFWLKLQRSTHWIIYMTVAYECRGIWYLDRAFGPVGFGMKALVDARKLDLSDEVKKNETPGPDSKDREERSRLIEVD